MGLIRFIFIVSIIYIIFRILGRYVLPFFVKRFVNKAKKNFYDQQQQYQQQQNAENTQEGEVNIKYNNKKKSDSSDKNLGDYVDFEEIDDDNEEK